MASVTMMGHVGVRRGRATLKRVLDLPRVICTLPAAELAAAHVAPTATLDPNNTRSTTSLQGVSQRIHTYTCGIH
jgi:hypothetical protein